MPHRKEFWIRNSEFWTCGDRWIRSVLEDVNPTGQPICSAPAGPGERVYWAGGVELALVHIVPDNPPDEPCLVR